MIHASAPRWLAKHPPKSKVGRVWSNLECGHWWIAIFHPDNCHVFIKETNHFMLCLDPIDYRCLPNQYCDTAVEYSTMGNVEWGNEIWTRMCVCKTDNVMLQYSLRPEISVLLKFHFGFGIWVSFGHFVVDCGTISTKWSCWRVGGYSI
jgi:hypothetical protein